MKLAAKARRDIGDYKLQGSGCRASGWVEKPVPLKLIETGDNKLKKIRLHEEQGGK
jgi:hypothetical protein